MSLNSVISASYTEASILTMKVNETSPLIRRISADTDSELGKTPPVCIINHSFLSLAHLLKNIILFF